MVDPEPLDGEMALASHWVVMKRFVFLVICFAVGATLSGCGTFPEEWDGSDAYSPGHSVSDRFDNDGTSGRDEVWDGD